MKTFVYGDLAFYPGMKTKIVCPHDVLLNTRMSFGFGLAIPMGMTNILLYFNAINFNTKEKVDFEK